MAVAAVRRRSCSGARHAGGHCGALRVIFCTVIASTRTATPSLSVITERDDIMLSEQGGGPSNSAEQASRLESLIERVVEATVARIQATAPPKPFIPSKECAQLIGVTPEHLSAMRARGEGPPWSGEGKWIRYERRAVLEWLASLPRQTTEGDEGNSLSRPTSRGDVTDSSNRKFEAG
jgi:hypothetical protein